MLRELLLLHAVQLHRTGLGRRPVRLAPHVHVLPVQDGARVVSPRGTTALTGATVYEWLRRIVPYLDGSVTVDELTDGLPDDKRAMVVRLVAALDDAGLLLREHPDAARRRRVAVTGNGPLAAAVVDALRGAGLTLVGRGAADAVVAVLDGPDDEPPDGARVCVVPRGDEVWIGDWRAARHRVTGWPAGPPTTLCALSADVAANMVGTAVARELAGLSHGELVRLQVPSLRGTVHPAPPEDGPREPFDLAVARLIDPRTGVLGEVSERDYQQLPLNVAAATVAGTDRLAIGAGHTAALARVRAARRGLELHLGASADRVVGIGDTQEAAETSALDLLCARLTASGPGRCVRVDLADLGGDDEAAAYRAMIDVLGVRPEVYDVTGPLGRPTLAYRARRRTLAYISAATADATVAAGLRAVLLDEQSRRAGQPDYAPEPVPQLDPTPGRTGSPSPPRPTVTPIECHPAVRHVVRHAVVAHV